MSQHMLLGVLFGLPAGDRERCITRDDEAAGALLAELHLIDEKAGVPAGKEPDHVP